MNNTRTFLHDMKSGEQVVAVVRRHWFILFRSILFLAIFFLLPFFALPLMAGVATAGGAVNIPTGIGLFFTSLWSLIIWNLLFTRWTDYYYDVWILTSLRIVDIDQKGLFHRDVATLFDLNHIEDVKDGALGILRQHLQLRRDPDRDRRSARRVRHGRHRESRQFRAAHPRDPAKAYGRGHERGT